MLIRKATLKDLPGIKKIDKFGNLLAGFSPLDKLDSKYKEPKGAKGYIEKFITGKLKWCIVAEEKGQILGFQTCEIKKQEPYYLVKKVGRLDLVFVDKKARGHGISGKLIDEACKIMKKAGVKYISLNVHSKNPAADIWRSYGFKDYQVKMWRKA